MKARMEMESALAMVRFAAESVMPALELGAVATAQEHLYNMQTGVQHVRQAFEKMKGEVTDEED